MKEIQTHQFEIRDRVYAKHTKTYGALPVPGTVIEANPARNRYKIVLDAVPFGAPVEVCKASDLQYDGVQSSKFYVGDYVGFMKDGLQSNVDGTCTELDNLNYEEGHLLRIRDYGNGQTRCHVIMRVVHEPADVPLSKLIHLGMPAWVSVPEPDSAAPKAGPGATKHDGTKPKYSLIPYEALQALTRSMGYGAKKYGAHNYKKGMLWTRLADACMRHVLAWTHGEDHDAESGLNHIDNALASLAMLRYNIEHCKELDDRMGAGEPGDVVRPPEDK